jgi:hypothetical protein
VATYSTVLGLKLNAESDPFELSDFIQNWGILDASPGTFICKSTSRPSWTSAQAGRLIFMTDLKQLSFWNGSSWNDLRDSAPIFAGGAFINSHVNPGSVVTFNVLTLTTPRPSALAIILTGAYTCPNNVTQGASQWITFDGVRQQMGGFSETVRFPGTPGDSGLIAGVAATTLAVVPSIAAGQHKIGVEVSVSPAYRPSVGVIGAKVIGIMSAYSSSNSL